MNAIARRNVGSKLALRGIDDIHRIAEVYAASGYWPDSRDVAQAFVKIAFGVEVGLPAYVAMSEVHIIQGKPTLGAGALAALVKGHPEYDFRVREHDEQVCAIEFYEKPQDCLGVSRFTMDDARAAGLTGNPSWRKYPRNMLFARAISNGVAWYCPDVTMGRVYTPDEMGSDFAGGTYTPEELGDEAIYSPPPLEDRALLTPASAGEPMGQGTVSADAGSRAPVADTAERASSAAEDQQQAGPAAQPPPSADSAPAGPANESEWKTASREVWDADHGAGDYDRRLAATVTCQHPPESIDVAEDDRYHCDLCGATMLSRGQMAKIHAVIRELAGHADTAAAPIPEPWKDDAESWVQVLKAQLVAAGVDSRKQLSGAQAHDLIEWLEAQRVPF